MCVKEWTIAIYSSFTRAVMTAAAARAESGTTAPFSSSSTSTPAMPTPRTECLSAVLHELMSKCNIYIHAIKTVNQLLYLAS